jgi:hypothetical protein
VYKIFLESGIRTHLRKLKAIPGSPRVAKAFISYAWPSDEAECDELQDRLEQLVFDLKEAGVTVLLDIHHLHLATDIPKFMISKKKKNQKQKTKNVKKLIISSVKECSPVKPFYGLVPPS